MILSGVWVAINFKQLQSKAVSNDPLSAPNDNAISLYGGMGGFIEVVGESHYQQAIKRAQGSAKLSDGYERFMAGLEPEPTNPHDSNAVRVHFRGETLGYLTKADAKKFLRTHSGAIGENRPIVCEGLLTGGTKGKPTIGVMLSFLIEKEQRYKRGLDATKRKGPKKKAKKEASEAE
ncbi:HIRAN domain containing protein [uncultured Caudovirales phage]|uniref:HIRAN domain containing protein n=1 Tax=uncultured Caudovirales phage TaxID=2100421 RepID=A0A6J5SXZ3_9CAUD|nr:HIRAN domain containing protein [uncultured Caudovirales phage]